jgi:hypothetical protein
VLDETEQSSLTYIGFSQGTTIMFAALSLVPSLRYKLNLFIALAPSTKPFGDSIFYYSLNGRTDEFVDCVVCAIIARTDLSALWPTLIALFHALLVRHNQKLCTY